MSSPALKRPVSVVVVVHSATGQILLLERVRPEGFWQSVTGSLEEGETARAAAQRELFEETGFGVERRLVDLKLVQRFPIMYEWRKRFPPGTRENIEYAFSFQLPRPVEPRLNRLEHTRFLWLTAGKALQRASSWTDRNAITKVVPAQTV